MYCIHCGTEHSVAAKFCQNCGEAIVWTQGARVEPEAGQTEKAAPPSTQDSKTHRDDSSHNSIPSQPKLEDFVATVPATHDVFSHPIKGFKSVKNGFSWPAFFFGFWWSLYKGLWLNALLYWVVCIVYGIIAGILLGLISAFSGLEVSDWFSYFIMIAVCIVWGFFGNNWVRANLTKRGYECVREGLGSGGIRNQNFRTDSEPANVHERSFSCPFCRHTMTNFGRCSKCGNTVDQWVLEANS